MHVRMCWLERGKRLGPLDQTCAEDVESSSLKFLVQQPIGWDFAQAVSRYPPKPGSHVASPHCSTVSGLHLKVQMVLMVYKELRLSCIYKQTCL